MRRKDLSIQLVTNLCGRDTNVYLRFVERSIRAGVTCVQLREKHADPAGLREFALQLQSVLRPFGAPLIINDHVDLALAVGADGVHLGQRDGCPTDARAKLGPSKIIGLTVENEEQIAKANQLDCIDYIGCGAIFPTKSKQDCAQVFGIDGLVRAVALSRHPVVAIGGINADNAGEVFRTGCDGVAIISAIHNSATPEAVILNIESARDHGYSKEA